MKKKTKKVYPTVIISGYFDPIHAGHIDYINRARKLAGEKGILIVIVNNTEQALLKKGYEFMPYKERIKVVQSIKGVDFATYSADADRTVRLSLQLILQHLADEGEKGPFIFANGGDRHNKEIPEAAICKSLGIKIVDGLGKKIQSSSELVKKARKHVKK